jgi:biotin operon repressor
VASDVTRIRGVASVLGSIADAADGGEDVGKHLDQAILELRGLRTRLFGPRKLEGSARERIRLYLVKHLGDWVTGEELAEVAGISEWARRVRELREDGMDIAEEHGNYRLETPPV